MTPYLRNFELLLTESMQERLIAESTAYIILEALDKSYKDLTVIKKKIADIAAVAQKEGMTVTASAMQKALEEMAKNPEATKKKTGIAKLANVFGVKVDNNPVLKSMSMLSTLESGFDFLEDIVSDPANFPKFKKNGPSLEEQSGNNAENVKKVLKKAFAAEGIFSKLKSLLGVSRIPFVDNEDIFIQELMTVPAKSLLQLRKSVLGGFTTKNVQSSVQDFVASEAPGVLVSPDKILPTSGQPATSTSQLISLVAAAATDGKGKTSATISAKAKDDPGQFLNSFIDSIAAQTKIKKDTIAKILNALVVYNNSKKSGKKGGKKGQKPEPGSASPPAAPVPAQESRSYITAEDVFDAKIKLFECDGTSSDWIDLLFEQKSAISNQSLKVFLEKIGKIQNARASKISPDAFRKVMDEFNEIVDKEKLSDEEKQAGLARLKQKFPNAEMDAPKKEPSSLSSAQEISKIVQDVIRASQGTQKELSRSESIFAQIESNPTKHKQVADVLKKNLQDVIVFIDSTGDKELIQQTSEPRARYEEIRSKPTPALVLIYSILQGLNEKISTWYKTLLNKSEDEKKQILSQLAKRETELAQRVDDEKKRNDQLKSELEKLASQSSEKDKAYDKLLKSSTEIIKKFVKELADELGEDPAKLQNDIADAGGIKKYIDAIKAKNAAEIAKAAADAGVPGLPEGPSPGAGAGEGSTEPSGRKEKAAAAIKTDLKNVKTDTIKKVLDVLPDWMISEVARRQAALLFEVKRKSLIH